MTFSETAVVPPKTYSNHTAIVGTTGATGHYLDDTAEQYYTHIEHTSTRPSVRVANGENIETSKRATVPLAKELSDKAKVGHIFDDLQSGSLISIGQLCNDNCVALFMKYDIQIYKDGKVVITRVQKRQRNILSCLCVFLVLIIKSRARPCSKGKRANLTCILR